MVRFEREKIPDTNYFMYAITERGLSQAAYCEAFLVIGKELSKLIMELGMRTIDDPNPIVLDLFSGLSGNEKWEVENDVLVSPTGTLWLCWPFEELVHLNLAFQSFALIGNTIQVTRKNIFDPRDIDALRLEKRIHQFILETFLKVRDFLEQDLKFEIRTLYPSFETLLTTEVNLDEYALFREFLIRKMDVYSMEKREEPSFDKCVYCWFKDCTFRNKGLKRAQKPAIERPFDGVNIQMVGLE